MVVQDVNRPALTVDYLRKFVKSERLERRVSRKRLAQLSGVHVETIRRFENGETRMNIEDFVKVIEALGFNLTITRDLICYLK